MKVSILILSFIFTSCIAGGVYEKIIYSPDEKKIYGQFSVTGAGSLRGVTSGLIYYGKEKKYIPIEKNNGSVLIWSMPAINSKYRRNLYVHYLKKDHSFFASGGYWRHISSGDQEMIRMNYRWMRK